MRIARDLHDVLADHITLVNAQAGVAQYLLHTDLDAADKALAGIAENTRAALDELRATLGLLRDESEEETRAPTPGSAQLGSLMRSFSDAGMDLSVEVRGIPRLLSGPADVAMYRIAEEALTNASKHAPGATVEVEIAWSDRSAQLTVTNTARSSEAAATKAVDFGTGHGLMGMRERAGAAGGSLSTAATPGGRLPCGSYPARCNDGTGPVTVRVLLADDQALLRATFRLLIESGPDLEVVGEAADGHEAVQIAQTERPDVVLMDIRMPELDGIQATQQMTTNPELDQVKVLILTTFETEELIVEALRSGASGYLGKGVEPGALLDAIRVVAAGESLLSPTATAALISRVLQQPSAAPEVGTKALAGLTPREQEIVVLVGLGLSNDEIAERLFISPVTAKTHVNRAMMKANAHDRAQLVILAYKNGLITPGQKRLLGYRGDA